jgi:hypothetical protein
MADARIIRPGDMNAITREQETQRRDGASRYITNLPLPKTAAKRKRNRERAQQKINETKTGVLTFLAVGRAAIWVSVHTEPDPDVREAKYRRLDSMWSEFEGRLLGIMRS